MSSGEEVVMTMQIRVYGPGCARCHELADNAREAVRASGVDATVEEVHDLTVLVMQGVLTTPALMIDGKVAMAGRVASVPRIRELLAASV
jgi:small redox-active disulfide protein 2